MSEGGQARRQGRWVGGAAEVVVLWLAAAVAVGLGLPAFDALPPANRFALFGFLAAGVGLAVCAGVMSGVVVWRRLTGNGRRAEAGAADVTVNVKPRLRDDGQ